MAAMLESKQRPRLRKLQNRRPTKFDIWSARVLGIIAAEDVSLLEAIARVFRELKVVKDLVVIQTLLDYSRGFICFPTNPSQ